MQKLHLQLLAAFTLIAALTPAYAVPVARMTWQAEATADANFCVSATYDNAPYDVFGTPVNFGTDVGGFTCTGSYNGSAFVANCTSAPDNSKFNFTLNVPAVLAPPAQNDAVPFVGNVTSSSGTVADAIGPVTYTFDGTQIWPGTTAPSATLPGCTGLSGLVYQFVGQGGFNAFQTQAVNTGTNVAVSSVATFTDPDTGTQRTANIGVRFADVASGGEVVVTATSSVAGSLNSNFSVNIGGLVPVYFDVSTTATITGPITVCQHYDDADNDGLVDGTGVVETDLRILHGEGSPYVFVDRTVLPVDTANNTVCAEVSNLSPFVMAVNVTTTSTHDSVVLPVGPVKVTIGSGKTAMAKPLKVKAQNADLTETAGHEIKLTIIGNTCPTSLLRDSLNQPVDFDFDPKAFGAQNSIVVGGGKVKVATLPLNVVAADFTTPNMKSPSRCTLTLSASAVATDTVIEPNPTNNKITVEIDVVDKNDF